jgi:transposase
MEAYSLDLRERICAACDEGVENHQEVADRFEVSRWFVQKLLRQRRCSGSIAARPRGHGPVPSVNDRDRQRLVKLVKQRPDAILAELCQLLRDCGGVSVSIWTMCRVLKSLRLVRKKRLSMRASGTHHACEHFAGTSRNASRRLRRTSWYSWMKAGSTPP